MTDTLSQTLSARCCLPDNQDLHAKSGQPSDPRPNSAKRRSRPKLAPDSDTGRMDRRAQMVHAQRTYRHKKELKHRNMERRVAELESTVNRVSDSLSEFIDMAVESDLHVTHPRLFDHLRDTVTHLKRATGGKENAPRELVLPVVFPANVSPEDTGPFGYLVNSLQGAMEEEPQEPTGLFAETVLRIDQRRSSDRSLEAHSTHPVSANQPSCASSNDTA
ncbi:hypothetical protein BDW71DRAFT_208239 [Aspergillus fruticulosus]